MPTSRRGGGNNSCDDDRSLLQRITSFIDSPCSGLGISSQHESPHPTRNTSQVDTRNLSLLQSTGTDVSNLVTPIKSTSRIKNRSSASRHLYQEKLNALLHGASLKPLSPIQPAALRRTKSFQATPSPTYVAAVDSVFWSEATDQFEAVYCGPVQECCIATDSPNRSTLQGNWSIFSGRGWCCSDVTSAATLDHNQSLPTSQVCDGYVDYVGQHHPHVPTNCQGCIFRQSLFDASGSKRDEELFYDSDYELYLRHSSRDKDEVKLIQKSRHRSRQSYPPSGTVDTQQSVDLTHNSLSDRQAYMYDYFMTNQHQQLVQTPLRTGATGTFEADDAACVQEALNSTWKLLWHTSSTDSRSAFLPHPRPCNAWIERGYRRNMNQAVEPRLMWRETKAHTTYAELMERPNSLSLLAIRRIVPGEQVAESFIFTKANCMIIVKSSLGKDYCFEASLTAERDKIIHLWKMTTARLVSYALTQNSEQMAQEFFNEYSVH